MKDLKPRRGAFLLARLIAEGEHEMQDFKHSVSDPLKIARSIAAFANHRGGRLLIGVKDNGVIAGVRNEEDIYVVESAAQLYCRPPQQVSFTAYRAEGGETVMVAEVAPAAKRPVEARDARGEWHTYVRVADENILAPELMTEAWQRQSHAGGESLQMTPAESWLLRQLDAGQRLSIEDYARGTHQSLRTAGHSAARLFTLGLVTLRHTPRGWVLVCTADEG